MIETPLFGRFQGENKRLAFYAATPYIALVRGTMGIGGGMILYGLAFPFIPDPSLYPLWWVGIGGLVLLAGIAAALSLQSISFNLRERNYRRRQGPGFLPTISGGNIQLLDAIVLITEQDDVMVRNAVTYHLMLYWKNGSDKPMLLQSDTRRIPLGQPLNIAAQPLLTQGARYAQALGIPFYDNSHFLSKNPTLLTR